MPANIARDGRGFRRTLLRPGASAEQGDAGRPRGGSGRRVDSKASGVVRAPHRQVGRRHRGWLPSPHRARPSSSCESLALGLRALAPLKAGMCSGPPGPRSTEASEASIGKLVATAMGPNRQISVLAPRPLARLHRAFKGEHCASAHLVSIFASSNRQSSDKRCCPSRPFVCRLRPTHA